MLAVRRIKFALIVGFLALLALPADVSAQCRNGSGPDMGDGIPYCTAPAPAQRQGSWHNYAAAVAWTYFEDGTTRYVTVSNYRRLEDASSEVMDKCRRESRQQKGWISCELADAVENSTIVIGKTKSGGLLTRYGTDPKRVKAEMIARCLFDRDPCKVVKVLDSRPQFY